MRALRRLGAVRGLPRWLLVDLPCRFYLSAEDRGSRPVWVYFVGWLVVVAGCTLGGGAIGAGQGGSFVDGLFVGARFGLLAVLAWIGYAVLVLLVLWFRGRSPAAVLNRHLAAPSADTRAGRHARESTDVPWRQAGDHLVSSGGLVLLACAVAVTGLVALWSHQAAVDQDTARTIADRAAASAAEGAVPGASPIGAGGYWTMANGTRVAAYALVVLAVLTAAWYVLERRRSTSPGRPPG